MKTISESLRNIRLYINNNDYISVFKWLNAFFKNTNIANIILVKPKFEDISGLIHSERETEQIDLSSNQIQLLTDLIDSIEFHSLNHLLSQTITDLALLANDRLNNQEEILINANRNSEIEENTGGNNVNVNGNNNIIIQDITNGEITLNVNGDIHKIIDEFTSLRSFLIDHNNRLFQYQGKSYPTDQLNDINYGFVNKSRPFNAHLVKILISAIAPYSHATQNFLTKAKEHQDWEQDEDIRKVALEIISKNFIGVIGIQLSKLSAIGIEGSTTNIQSNFIRKCIEITQIVFDLINFSLLSKLWDTETFQFSVEQKNTLTKIFDGSFKKINTQYDIFLALLNIFETNHLELPISELEKFNNNDNDFSEICQNLNDIKERLNKEKITLLDCGNAEIFLTKFLGEFAFLIGYNMVSIKNIGYQEVKNTDPKYLHRYSKLGINSQSNNESEKLNFIPVACNTNAILLYKGNDYLNSINLFPFIIDYNSLSLERGNKICFFSTNHLPTNDDDDNNVRALDYIFLENSSIITISQRSISDDLNKLMEDNNKRKKHNLNILIDSFQAAKNHILNDNLIRYEPNNQGNTQPNA